MKSYGNGIVNNISHKMNLYWHFNIEANLHLFTSEFAIHLNRIFSDYIYKYRKRGYQTVQSQSN